MSHMGQTEKHSVRADVFRSSSKNGRWFSTPKHYADRMLSNIVEQCRRLSALLQTADRAIASILCIADIKPALGFDSRLPGTVIRSTWMEGPDNLSPVRQVVFRNLLPKGARSEPEEYK